MKFVDASAPLAALFNEPGRDRVLDWLGEGGAVVGSVNCAEVLPKRAQIGGVEVS